MERLTQRYHAVARRFCEQASSRNRDAVPEPATVEELAAAGRALGCRFPASYGCFQLEFGDFAHGPLDIYSE